MSEPWYDGNLYGWLPGTVLGCLGGLWGGLAGVLVPTGRGRRVVLGGAWVLLAYSAVLLILGVIAFAAGQPYGVWFGLGWAGLIGLVVIGINMVPVWQALRRAEERGMTAQDLT